MPSTPSHPLASACPPFCAQPISPYRAPQTKPAGRHDFPHRQGSPDPPLILTVSLTFILPPSLMLARTGTFWTFAILAPAPLLNYDTVPWIAAPKRLRLVVW